MMDMMITKTRRKEKVLYFSEMMHGVTTIFLKIENLGAGEMA